MQGAYHQHATTGRRRQKRRTRQVGMTILLCTGMMLVGLLLYLLPQMRLVALDYQLAALQKQRQRALQTQKELRAELATVSQLSRLEEIAVERLQLHRPHMTQVIYVRPAQHVMASGERP